MVRLIGVVNNFPPIYVVMELMARGDLKSFLISKDGASLTNEVSLTRVSSDRDTTLVRHLPTIKITNI